MNRFTMCLICAFNLAIAPNLMASSQNTPTKLKTIKFLGLSSTLPASWVDEKPSSSMRLAQYRVPGRGSNGDANLVLYYFGQGQGGSADANIARWQSQFTTAEGGVVEPKLETMEVNGIAVTVVELRGHYARGVGMGPVGTAAPDQILLAAIVESTQGNIHIQLHGPANTVSMQRDAYMAFIRNITP